MSANPSPDRWAEVKRIFLRASEVPPPERDAFAVAESNGRLDILEEVRALLRSDSAPQAFAEDPAAAIGLTPDGRSPQAQLSPEIAPSMIGEYRVVSLLGEGTFGLVYLAEQERPKRLVAVKVLRSGLLSETAVRRFELEPEIMARLQHPGIARVIGVGAIEHAAQRPYFVMEYVDGEPLIGFAKTRKLSVRERVEMFIDVCDAVQHAHTKQVLHRDLKPSNILVTAEGKPRVLDFGVARLVSPDVRAVTMATRPGQVVGTLAYMSPEQAAGDTASIDTRSDIYSLGAVLYELLSNRLPIDVDGRLVHEAVLSIRDSVPSSLTTVRPECGIDLSTIVGKALAKERERRYTTVSEFAADLRRYLADEPVLARRPSLAYELRKFTRRHRALVAGILIATVGLAVGAVAATAFAFRAYEATHRQQLDSTQFAKTLASTAQFFPKIIDSSRAKPLDPAVVEQQVALLELAMDNSKRSTEPDAQQVADLRRQLGVAYYYTQRLEEAELMCRDAIARQANILDDMSLDVGLAKYNLGKILYEQPPDRWTQDRKVECESLMAAAALVFEQQDGSDGNFGRLGLYTLNAFSNVGILRVNDLRKTKEAEEPLRRAYLGFCEALAGSLISPEARPNYEFGKAFAAGNLTAVLTRTDRAEDEIAERAARDVYKYCIQTNNPQLGTAAFNLSRIYVYPERYQEAAQLANEIFATNPGLGRNLLVEAYLGLNDLTAAREALTRGSPDSVDPCYEGLVLAAEGRRAEAEVRLNAAIAQPERQGYEKSRCKLELGRFQLEDGDFEGAQELLVNAHVALIRQVGRKAGFTREADRTLDQLYAAWGKQRSDMEPAVHDRIKR
jgi:serine/threonine protein kinase